MNRNATLIDTAALDRSGFRYRLPLHGPGRTELRMSEPRANEGRGAHREVLRERNANYHAFVFIDGTRPDDTLITASLDEAGTPVRGS